jgi:hypothetical protein
VQTKGAQVIEIVHSSEDERDALRRALEIWDCRLVLDLPVPSPAAPASKKKKTPTRRSERQERVVTRPSEARTKRNLDFDAGAAPTVDAEDVEEDDDARGDDIIVPSESEEEVDRSELRRKKIASQDEDEDEEEDEEEDDEPEELDGQDEVPITQIPRETEEDVLDEDDEPQLVRRSGTRRVDIEIDDEAILSVRADDDVLCND